MRTMYHPKKGLKAITTKKTLRCRNKSGRRAFKGAETFYHDYMEKLRFRQTVRSEG